MSEFHRVYGIDLSLTGTGVARIEAASTGETARAEWDLIKTAGKKGDSFAQRHARLELIVDRIEELFDGDAGADLIVLEAPSYGSVHGAQHDRSGLWWMAFSRLTNHGPVAAVSPNGRAKYATGKGNAPKDAVLSAVVRNFPDVDVSDNNVADALVLASMGLHCLGVQVWPVLAARSDAVAAVDWGLE